MLLRWLTLAILLSSITGCQSREATTELPGYQVVVPDDVPLLYVAHGKDGQRFEDNGHATYRWAHREGWADCWNRHQQGLLDPKDESSEPSAMQEHALAARARNAGFHECRRSLP